MATAAEQKFQEFDWSKSEAWLKYYDSLYPHPPNNVLDKFKRKWFKANIDKNLSLITAPSSAPPSAGQPVPKLDLLRNIALIGFALGIAASFIYILPLSSKRMLPYAFAAYTVGYLSALVSAHGTPKWSQQYWLEIVMDDLCHGFFLCTIARALNSWIALVLPFLSAIIYISNQPMDHVLRYLPSSWQQRASTTLAQAKFNRYRLMQHRSDTELFVGFFLILLLILRSISFAPPLLYWNLMRFKYRVDPCTQASFRKLDGQILNVFHMMSDPQFLHSGYAKAKALLSKLVA